MKSITFLIIFFSSFVLLKAQETQTEKIAILPFVTNGIDLTSVQTAELIFRMELSQQTTLDIVSEKHTLNALGTDICTDEECAKAVGDKLGAKQVLLCKLNPLGEKIIVQYILVETSSGKKLLAEQTTALSVEDLETVMKRVAISVGKQKPFTTNVEVGNIVKNETIEPLRRASRINLGLCFGYLFPSQGYDNDRKSFTINGYLGYELPEVAVGLMLGARQGFAINVYSEYLFSKTDVCPYAGGSLGFHWVQHDNYFTGYGYDYSSSNNNKVSDGIELGLRTGIRLFHTYNFQVMINFEYIMTFNDYNDKAFVFTIGIL